MGGLVLPAPFSTPQPQASFSDMSVLHSFECLAHNDITSCYPHPSVSCPRLPNGIRRLGMDKNHPIRIKSAIPFFTKDWVNCRFISFIAWDGAKLYRGVGVVFALAPCDLDFLTGQHMHRDTKPLPLPASTSSAHLSLLPRLSSFTIKSSLTGTATGAPLPLLLIST